jgi:hypothetical protein
MPFEIINSRRSKSVVRITGNTATRINLNQLSTDVATEIVNGASITHLTSSTDGKWIVYRGNDATGVPVLSLFGENDIPFSQFDVSVGNTATANIYVTNSGTDGTLLLVLSKTATYTVDADTGAPL